MAVWQLAFRARKVHGTFEDENKVADLSRTKLVLVFVVDLKLSHTANLLSTWAVLFWFHNQTMLKCSDLCKVDGYNNGNMSENNNILGWITGKI